MRQFRLAVVIDTESAPPASVEVCFELPVHPSLALPPPLHFVSPADDDVLRCILSIDSMASICTIDQRLDLASPK